MRQRIFAAVIIIAATALIAAQIDWSRAPGAITIPIIAATILQLFPPLAVLSLARPVPRARWWIAMWGVAFFISDVSQLILGRALGNNLIFLSFSHPIEDGLLLWAYSHWQSRPETRLAFRLAVPLLAIVSWFIAFKAGEVATFKTFAAPFRTLILLAAVVSTLVTKVMQEREVVWNKDWLWTSLGVALYFGTYVTVEPISKALLPESPDVALNVFIAKAYFDCVAFLLIWKGMRCPVPQTSSGSTSAQHSPSRSF